MPDLSGRGIYVFRLSKGAEYTIRSLVYIAGKTDGDVSYVEEIAMARDIPRAYLSKLLQHLARRGVLKSYRGQEGGFVLARQAKDITLLEVIEAVEGPVYFNECLIEEGLCNREKICSVHAVWQECLEKFVDTLGKYSLAYLSESEEELFLGSKKE